MKCPGVVIIISKSTVLGIFLNFVEVYGVIMPC